MVRLVALEYLTFRGLPAHVVAALAGKAGFEAIGVRMHAADADERVPDLRVGSSAHQALSAALRDAGVGVFDIEVFPLAPATQVTEFEPLLEAGASLGARFINVVADDPDLDRLTDTLGALTVLATRYGLTPALEPMMWKTVTDLRTAVRVAAGAGALVQLDALHLHRAGDNAAVVADIDPRMWSYLQLSDAPAAAPSAVAAELREEGRTARLLPGQGNLPLRELLDALPTDLPWAAEAPSLTGREQLGDEGYARALRRSVNELVA